MLLDSFHNYKPFHFTHQGASWAGKQSTKWLGTEWKGSADEKNEVRDYLDIAADWGEKHNRPIYMGEFGAYSKADMASRCRWTAFVRSEAEKRKMSWAYWEFCAGFGVYDKDQGKWRQGLLQALIPRN